MTQNRMRRRWPIVLAILALTYLVGAMFWPMLGFGFINLDVHDQVISNPHIRGLNGENLKHILTSRCVSSYYPFRTLTYAIDHQLWGLNPTGFKLTNGLIHLGNVLLLFWLVLRLFRHPTASDRSPGAWWEVSVAAFSAGVFAIHPIVVEPVVWVAGREELLMTLGALCCVHFHLTARRLSEDSGKRSRALVCYVAAAFCCAAACLSNAAAAAIPLLITAWDLLTLERPRLSRILFGTSALWLIGMATIALKVYAPDGDAASHEESLFTVLRLRLVLNLYWLNLKTLFWPTELAVFYDWPGRRSLLHPEVILGAIAVGLTIVALWLLRRKKLTVFGLVWFGLAMAPSSQILLHSIPRADRFLYLPLAGLVMMMAMGLRRLANTLKGPVAAGGIIAGWVACLFLLIALSAGPLQRWRDRVELWQYCLEVAPENPMAHCYLADSLAEAGRLEQAMQHYDIALRMTPDNTHALNNCAWYLATTTRAELRNYDLAIELAARGCELTDWRDPELRHTLAVSYTYLANVLASGGEFGGAIECLHNAIKASPEYDLPLFNLALLLSTWPDESQRKPDEAVRLAERARQLADSPDAHRLSILATVYAETGRFEEAVAVMREAIEVARTGGDANDLARLRENLRLFENGTRPTASP